jgi:GTPase Era involved in 16S rRNA processing
MRAAGAARLSSRLIECSNAAVFLSTTQQESLLHHQLPPDNENNALQAVPGRWQFAAGQSHGASPGELALELVREKLYRRLNQELPYTLEIHLRSVQELPAGQGLHISIGVTVKNKRLKAMVVGREGSIIQEYVTLPTEAELAKILKQPVKLLVAVHARDA